jgi:hypothetical protein
MSDPSLIGRNVFAMPNTGESSIVFLEATACDTPVLTGNLDGSVD